MNEGDTGKRKRGILCDHRAISTSNIWSCTAREGYTARQRIEGGRLSADTRSRINKYIDEYVSFV